MSNAGGDSTALDATVDTAANEAADREARKAPAAVEYARHQAAVLRDGARRQLAKADRLRRQADEAQAAADAHNQEADALLASVGLSGEEN